MVIKLLKISIYKGDITIEELIVNKEEKITLEEYETGQTTPIIAGKYYSRKDKYNDIKISKKKLK